MTVASKIAVALFSSVLVAGVCLAQEDDDDQPCDLGSGEYMMQGQQGGMGRGMMRQHMHDQVAACMQEKMDADPETDMAKFRANVMTYLDSCLSSMAPHDRPRGHMMSKPCKQKPEDKK